MKTIVEALQDLYVALGGKKADVAEMSLNSEVIEQLTTVVGDELPTVTDDDNGDVLTVVDGAWGKAVPSGGSGKFDVFFSTSNWTVWETTKTFAEVKEALTNGEIIDGYYYDYSGTKKPMEIQDDGADSIVFMAIQPFPTDGYYYLYTFTLTSAGVSCAAAQYEMTPHT